MGLAAILEQPGGEFTEEGRDRGEYGTDQDGTDRQAVVDAQRGVALQAVQGRGADHLLTGQDRVEDDRAEAADDRHVVGDGRVVADVEEEDRDGRDRPRERGGAHADTREVHREQQGDAGREQAGEDAEHEQLRRLLLVAHPGVALVRSELAAVGVVVLGVDQRTVGEDQPGSDAQHGHGQGDRVRVATEPGNPAEDVADQEPADHTGRGTDQQDVGLAEPGQRLGDVLTVVGVATHGRVCGTGDGAGEGDVRTCERAEGHIAEQEAGDVGASSNPSGGRGEAGEAGDDEGEVAAYAGAEETSGGRDQQQEDEFHGCHAFER